ncbi:MAG: hypothetical protein HY332_07165 [Chloroflexi bacterium]|nr:hypothetical protein [Chloroflexota bacterium]
MAAKVDAEYQVVIDPDVREHLGVKPGSIAVQTVEGDCLKVRFLPPEHNRSLAGSLSKYAHGRPPITDWAAAKQAAWEAEVAERWGPGIDKAIAISALLLCRPSGRVSFADALINADARSHGLTTLYTFDQQFLADGLDIRPPRQRYAHTISEASPNE